MKRYKGLLGFLRMKYEQFIIREVDRLGLGFIWKDQIHEDEWGRYQELYYGQD